MPQISEKKHYLDHLCTFVDSEEHLIDVPTKYLKNVDKVETMKAE